MKGRIKARAALTLGAAVLAVGAAGGGIGYAVSETSQTDRGTIQVAPAQQQPPARGRVTQGEILALFDRWNAALATGDPEKVADLYAPDAVLLPTVSKTIRTDRAGIVDYFAHFLKKKPQGTKIRSIVKVIDENSAIDTGVYRFTLTAEDGTRSTVDARYTYEYEKLGGTWLIVNHHSSVLPTGD
jgi:uncharacterized protein (TIGR02246 family)